MADGAAAGKRLAQRLDAEHCFALAPILQAQIAPAFPKLPPADQECLAKGLVADPAVRARLVDVLAGRSGTAYTLVAPGRQTAGVITAGFNGLSNFAKTTQGR